MNDKIMNKLLFGIMMVAIFAMVIQYQTMAQTSLETNMNVSANLTDEYAVSQDIASAQLDLTTVAMFMIALFVLILSFKFLRKGY